MKHTQVTHSFQGNKKKYYSCPRSLSWPLSPPKGSSHPKLTSKLKGSWSAALLRMDGLTQFFVNMMRFGSSVETHFWVCLWVSRKVSLSGETYSENRQHYFLSWGGEVSREWKGWHEAEQQCSALSASWLKGHLTGVVTCMALALTWLGWWRRKTRQTFIQKLRDQVSCVGWWRSNNSSLDTLSTYYTEQEWVGSGVIIYIWMKMGWVYYSHQKREDFLQLSGGGSLKGTCLSVQSFLRN